MDPVFRPVCNSNAPTAVQWFRLVVAVLHPDAQRRANALPVVRARVVPRLVVVAQVPVVLAHANP